MAEKTSKVPGNVKGSYYVDDQCIACNACITEAGNFFEMNDDEGYAFVSKQPSTPEEIQKCENAIKVCPVESIGNDG